MVIGIRSGANVGGGEGYDPPYRREDATFTVSTLAELQSARRDASNGDVIWVESNATIDIGSSRVDFPTGVVLASDRGQNGSDGGLIRRSSGFERDSDYGISVTDARVSGLRLEGQFFNESDPHWGHVLRLEGSSAEIDNCEISGGGYAGVRDNAETTAVHHCYIHDNVAGGNGYGVATGGYTEIYSNYFEHNRHAIAGSGTESYDVYDNFFDASHTHHVVDMHQVVNGYQAGVRLHVHHNKCEADDVPFVRIRGIPAEGATIQHNWIYMTDPPCASVTGGGQCAINQTGHNSTSFENVYFNDNHYGTDQPPEVSDRSPLRLLVYGGLFVGAIGVASAVDWDEIRR